MAANGIAAGPPRTPAGTQAGEPPAGAQDSCGKAVTLQLRLASRPTAKAAASEQPTTSTHAIA
jgi:hypothetical protein